MPPDALNPAAVLVPVGLPPDTPKPLAAVVPVGLPSDTAKPLAAVIPVGHLSDMLHCTTLRQRHHNQMLCQVHRCLLQQASIYLARKKYLAVLVPASRHLRTAFKRALSNHR